MIYAAPLVQGFSCNLTETQQLHQMTNVPKSKGSLLLLFTFYFFPLFLRVGISVGPGPIAKSQSEENLGVGTPIASLVVQPLTPPYLVTDL